MKTSNYVLSAKDPNAVAISVGKPRWFGGIKAYAPLAPTRAMLKMNEADYMTEYDKILAGLDPQKVWDELHALVEGEPIMLCWEAFNIRCHRRYVAEWFEKHLGFEVAELGHDRAESVPFVDQARAPEKPAKAKKSASTVVKSLLLFLFN